LLNIISAKSSFSLYLAQSANHQCTNVFVGSLSKMSDATGHELTTSEPGMSTEILPVSSLSEKKIRFSKFAILLGDMLAIYLAFAISNAGVSTGKSFDLGNTFTLAVLSEPARFIGWAAVCGLGLITLLMSYQHYSDRRPFWDELGDVIRLVAVLSMLDMTLVSLIGWNASHIWWALSWSLVAVFLISMRMVTRSLLKKLNLWVMPTIIVGIGSNAAEAALALQSQPEMGLEVCGFVDPGQQGTAHTESSCATYPRFSAHRMAELAKQDGFQWVIALEHSQSDQREYWLRQLAQWNVPNVGVIPAMRGVPLHGTDMSHFFSHEVALLRMRNNLRRWPARLTKRIFDTVTACLLLVVLSPFMVAITLWIRKDGGPALFAHKRVGKQGRMFDCYKFRTMVVDAEAQLEQLLQSSPALRTQWVQDHKLKTDPRISAFGHLLRRTSLDELPQLLNVVRGEMSLVGPRPVVSGELKRYGEEVGYYLMVRPGMTGLWQVSGRNDIDYDARVYLDTWYVKNWSLWHDQIILFKTISVVLNRAGAY